MSLFHSKTALLTLLAIFLGAASPALLAEEDYVEDTYQEDTEAAIDEEPAPTKLKPAKKKSRTIPTKKEPRKYFSDSSPRSDAGIFHVAFALGGNVYFEPKVFANNNEFADDYFKDFGYQGGVYFDYDYSRMAENIPLALRGFLGYKYALNSTHIFAVEGMVRRMFQLSENASFGLGAGVSLATWFRKTVQVTNNETAQLEQTILLPTFIIGAGFDFNPFMVDLKWMVHRFGVGQTLMGAEFYFGVRL